MKVGIYARVSTQEQQTLPLQIKDLREYAEKRKWKIEVEITDVASGAKTRPKREELLKLARQRKIDCILVWRLDRFGRNLANPLTALDELNHIGVSFVSLNESLDLSKKGCFYDSLSSINHLKLPNVANIRSDHIILLLALKGGGEFRHIRERTVDAKARDGVRVVLRLICFALRSGNFRPSLRPAQKEKLFGREIADVRWFRLALH